MTIFRSDAGVLKKCKQKAGNPLIPGLLAFIVFMHPLIEIIQGVSEINWSYVVLQDARCKMQSAMIRLAAGESFWSC